MREKRNKQSSYVPELEDALAEHSLSSKSDFIEISLKKITFIVLFAVLFAVVIAVGVRITYLSVARGGFYDLQATANAHNIKPITAPRGVIYGRNGEALAKNKSAFSALLDPKKFARQEGRENILLFIEENLGVSSDKVEERVAEAIEREILDPIVIKQHLIQDQIISLKTSDFESLYLAQDFQRDYIAPHAFSSILGYVGLPTQEDLKSNKRLLSQSQVGKAGAEEAFDNLLRGTPGEHVETSDALGSVLHTSTRTEPSIGEALHLSIDEDLQRAFYNALSNNLARLSRSAGVGIALNPQNGEVLALLSLPTYDAEALSGTGNDEKQAILEDDRLPLFNRAIGGRYSPGSTIKPLHGVAALAEGVINSQKTIFSPGYLEIPNPYHANQPSRFLDWQYQGNVDLSSALAKSSNVYFYSVIGGVPTSAEAPPQVGVGIERLRTWWQRFGLGEKTGIELSGEAKGLLPSPEWKEEHKEDIWRLGDTYNVAIGQGDFLLTPVQLIRYISAIANGGKLYRPTILKGEGGDVQEDLQEYSYEISEVQKGMVEAVTSPEGTARSLGNLPFAVAGKTGSAQVANNSRENAFFVGYGPTEHPEIAILVLVENSKEGSLNAVPVAREIFKWYHENRM